MTDLPSLSKRASSHSTSHALRSMLSDLSADWNSLLLSCPCVCDLLICFPGG